MGREHLMLNTVNLVFNFYLGCLKGLIELFGCFLKLLWNVFSQLKFNELLQFVQVSSYFCRKVI